MKDNRGNRTTQRGRGYRARLTKAEQDALGKIAERHGYSGALVDGILFKPAVELTLAIISGEVTTILLDTEERAALIAWLEEQAPTSGRLEETIRALAAQLRRAAERERALEDEGIQEAIEERRSEVSSL